MPNFPAIEAQAVTKAYGAIRALKGVDLQVARGQIFGLIGANGAGKSTLIKLMVGALRTDAGRLRVLGLDPLREAAELRQQLGYMPQSAALYEDLSAFENVHFFGRAHRLPQLRQRVAEALDFVELSQRGQDPVSTLSGGMKQRVSLACALVHRPELLLLDEPTAGVDLKLRSAFWRHFKSLAQAGTTILVSTHQMDEAVHCDQLAIISEARIVAQDTPQELMHSGRATVRVWRGGQSEALHFEHYPTQLPVWLREAGAPAIERLEIEPSPLEDIVLSMLDGGDARQEA